MGHEDGGHAEPVVQFADLDAHLHTQLRVQIGQGLIEQEHLGFADHGARHGDALPLTTRQSAGLAIQKVGKADGLRDGGDALLPLGLADTTDPQGVADIFRNAHMGIKSVILEHHGAAALARLELVDDFSVNRNLAAADRLKARHHAQQRGFAAARWAKDHDEFAGLDFKVDAANHRRFVIGLGDAIKNNAAHGFGSIICRLRSGRARTSAA